MTRKWDIINDNSNSNYAAANDITYNTKSLKSNLCDYNDAYNLVAGDIIVVAAPVTQAAFRNCATFTKCITKIDGTTIGDAEDLELVIPMYNLIEYSSDYYKTTGSYGFIRKMKQLMMQILLMTIILNLLNIRLNYWETQLLRLIKLLMEY